MSVQEFLDALSYALQLSSFSQIVGFRDPHTGVIIPPSIVISDLDQINKNETYEVMIRQVSSQPFQSADKGQFEETHASFNARVGNMQQVIGQPSMTNDGFQGINQNEQMQSDSKMQRDPRGRQQHSRQPSTAPAGVHRESGT
jgi:hypothetical protein